MNHEQSGIFLSKQCWAHNDNAEKENINPNNKRCSDMIFPWQPKDNQKFSHSRPTQTRSRAYDKIKKKAWESSQAKRLAVNTVSALELTFTNGTMNVRLKNVNNRFIILQIK